MEISALASGSSGNCFYIENNGSAVLIDAGISAKKIVENLAMLKKSPEKVKAIFITHEHSDHIRGADVFARHFNVPVYATRKTAQSCLLCSEEKLVNFIRNNESLDIHGMRIDAFSKSHESADPVSYSITNGRKISVITDVGYGCKNVVENVSDSDFLFMESNYDEIMLEQGPYPPFLKKWIKSNEGHLSNLQSGLCILEHASSRLGHVVLSHLSKNNNTPLLALGTFSSLLRERKDLSPKISISYREKPTSLFRI